MCDQTEIEYLDGDVVWVKLGSCWWPGEVVGPDKLPPDVLPSFRKPPIAVVKFFQETTYEYVKNINCIYKYNCTRKNEFINKGLYMYRAKRVHMEKFPEDVIRAEIAVGGDDEILTRDEFQEIKKESYAGLFGESAKKITPAGKRGRRRGRPSTESPSVSTTPKKRLFQKTDYKAHILLQKKDAPVSEGDSSEVIEERSKGDFTPSTCTPSISTPVSSSGIYACPSCNFSTTRLNVLILHNRTHSITYTPYTPTPKKPTKTISPKTSKPPKPKTPKTLKEKDEKPPEKRSADLEPANVVKKQKIDPEIKSSILADWDDNEYEVSNDESMEVAVGAESPTGAESPAVPTPADEPSTQIPLSELIPEESAAVGKPESSQDSKYEFCEDEEWHVEAGLGRKIPRVKNSKRKEDNKSLSLDEDEVAKEVAALLNKTTLPELPSIPEPLKIEENFPEPSIVKSPDKSEQPAEAKPPESVVELKQTKAIFKTKTFFRSRHSRSQDAIGKYVAEQLNAAERIDLVDSEPNGSGVVTPETSESPPIEPVKVARLAPKIQLKKMKAEAAQLREKEKILESTLRKPELEPEFSGKATNKLQDVLWGTQEIKPINKDTPEKVFLKESWRGEASKPTMEKNISPKSTILDATLGQHCNETEDTISPKSKILDAVKASDVNASDIMPEISKPEQNSQPNIALEKSQETICLKDHQNLVALETEEPKPQENNPNLLLEKMNEKTNLSTQPDLVPHISNEPILHNKLDCNETSSKLPEISPSISSTLTLKSNMKNTGITSPEKPIVKSPIKITTTPKKSHVKIIIESVSKEEDPQNIPIKIGMRSPLKTVDSDEISPKNDFKIAAQTITDVEKSPNVILNVSPQRNSVLKSHKKMYMARTPPKFPEIDHKSPIKTSQDLLRNIRFTPESKIFDRSPVKREGDKKSSLPVVSKSSPQILNDNTKSLAKMVVDTKSFQIDTDNAYTSTAPPVEKLKPYETMEPFMSESTASAVDALLSVSRETDRVPRLVGNDPPEDLFEDDHKDSSNNDEETLKMDCEQNNENVLYKIETEVSNDPNVESTVALSDASNNKEENVNNLPSESDLQIAETLMNLPSTTLQNKSNNHQEDLPIEKQDIFAEVVSNEVQGIAKNQNETMSTNDLIESIDIINMKSNNSSQNVRFETEQEKSENFSAAQSLVQMSEYIDHKMNVDENKMLSNVTTATDTATQNKINIDDNSIEQNVASLSNDNNSDDSNCKTAKYETTSSKLMKILEEPTKPKAPPFRNKHTKLTTPVKPMIITGKEKILNFDVAKSSLKEKCETKQKIIIRRATPYHNNLTEVVASPEKIVLSRSNTSNELSSVQTFTIQGPPPQDPKPEKVKQIIVAPKLRKINKTPTKLQKIKQPTLLSKVTQQQVTESCTDIFDINSMPVVLSEDILTPESIEKMPVVMSDGNFITSAPRNPPKLIKTKPTILDHEKVTISKISAISNKPELKTLLMSNAGEVTKITTPNILSKSSKVRAGKPMLVIDKATGKQKLIVTKPEPVVKELKQAPSLIQQPQASKTEKFILLPSPNSPKQTGRTQKIVIDPQTGKAHVLLAKEMLQNSAENKSVSNKLIPPQSCEANAPGNTVMIITNAQGAQSRIVLTPEHEKMLFPNKQPPSATQPKIITHRLNTKTGLVEKKIVTTNSERPILQKTIVTSTSAIQPTKIISKQKSAIITSRGQLIVGAGGSSAGQNIVPMPEARQTVKSEIKPIIRPEIRQVTKPEMRQVAKPPELRQVTKFDTRPTLKRIVSSDSKKIVQKNSSEPLIFLQQKSGAVMQLTAAQFEHLQRTGQIVQKIVSTPDKKIAPQTEKKLTLLPEKMLLPLPEKKILKQLEKKILPTPEMKILPALENKVSPPPEKKIIIQKSITIPGKGSVVPAMQKQRVRKNIPASHSLAKRPKHELVISPSSIVLQPPVPPLTPLSTTYVTSTPSPSQAPNVTISSIIPTVISSSSVSTTQAYPELENFEELLPSTAIARQPEPALEPLPESIKGPEPLTEPPPGQLSDGQLLAVPGETVGGIPGTFYLCMEENGTFTPIDNRPLILENNQLVPIEVDPTPTYQQPERRDILEAALANSDVFHSDSTDGPDFRDLNANVSVHCRVSETSSTLNQPIMTPVEMPTKGNFDTTTIPTNLEDGLAVIGVTPHTVPTSLELPITVTDPRIAPKTTDPLSNNNYTTLVASPNTQKFVSAAAETGGISMPLLTNDEAVGKSMPILTDDMAVSDVDSMECDEDVGASWSRRLFTPNSSENSEMSVEIPLQPHIQFTVADAARHV